MSKGFIQKVKNKFGELSKALQDKFQNTFQLMLENYISDYVEEVSRLKLPDLINGIKDVQLNKEYFNKIIGYGVLQIESRLIKVDVKTMKIKLSGIELEVSFCKKVSDQEYYNFLKLTQEAQKKELDKIQKLKKLREELFNSQNFAAFNNEEENEKDNMQTIWSVFETYFGNSVFIVEQIKIVLNINVINNSKGNLKQQQTLSKQNLILGINHVQMNLTKISKPSQLLDILIESQITGITLQTQEEHQFQHEFFKLNEITLVSFLQLSEKYEYRQPPIVQVQVEGITMQFDPFDINFLISFMAVYDNNEKYLNKLSQDFNRNWSFEQKHKKNIISQIQQPYLDKMPIEQSLMISTLQSGIFDSSHFVTRSYDDDYKLWHNFLEQTEQDISKIELVECLLKIKDQNTISINNIGLAVYFIKKKIRQLKQIQLQKKINENINENYLILRLQIMKCTHNKKEQNAYTSFYIQKIKMHQVNHIGSKKIEIDLESNDSQNIQNHILSPQIEEEVKNNNSKPLEIQQLDQTPQWVQHRNIPPQIQINRTSSGIQDSPPPMIQETPSKLPLPSLKLKINQELLIPPFSGDNSEQKSPFNLPKSPLINFLQQFPDLLSTQNNDKQVFNFQEQIQNLSPLQLSSSNQKQSLQPLSNKENSNQLSFNTLQESEQNDALLKSIFNNAQQDLNIQDQEQDVEDIFLSCNDGQTNDTKQKLLEQEKQKLFQDENDHSKIKDQEIQQQYLIYQILRIGPYLQKEKKQYPRLQKGIINDYIIDKFNKYEKSDKDALNIKIDVTNKNMKTLKQTNIRLGVCILSFQSLLLEMFLDLINQIQPYQQSQTTKSNQTDNQKEEIIKNSISSLCFSLVTLEFNYYYPQKNFKNILESGYSINNEIVNRLFELSCLRIQLQQLRMKCQEINERFLDLIKNELVNLIPESQKKFYNQISSITFRSFDIDLLRELQELNQNKSKLSKVATLLHIGSDHVLDLLILICQLKQQQNQDDSIDLLERNQTNYRNKQEFNKNWATSSSYNFQQNFPDLLNLCRFSPSQILATVPLIQIDLPIFKLDIFKEILEEFNFLKSFTQKQIPQSPSNSSLYQSIILETKQNSSNSQISQSSIVLVKLQKIVISISNIESMLSIPKPLLQIELESSYITQITRQKFTVSSFLVDSLCVTDEFNQISPNYGKPNVREIINQVQQTHLGYNASKIIIYNNRLKPSFNEDIPNFMSNEGKKQKFLNPFSIIRSFDKKSEFSINITYQEKLDQQFQERNNRMESVQIRLQTMFVNLKRTTLRIPNYKLGFLTKLLQINQNYQELFQNQGQYEKSSPNSQLPQDIFIDSLQSISEIQNIFAIKIEVTDFFYDSFPTYTVRLLREIKNQQFKQNIINDSFSNSVMNLSQEMEFFGTTRSGIYIQQLNFDITNDKKSFQIDNIQYLLQRTEGALYELTNPQLLLLDESRYSQIIDIIRAYRFSPLLEINQINVNLKANGKQIQVSIDSINSTITYDKIESLMDHLSLTQALLERGFMKDWPNDVNNKNIQKGKDNQSKQNQYHSDKYDSQFLIDKLFEGQTSQIKNHIYKFPKDVFDEFQVILDVGIIKIILLNGFTYLDQDVFQIREKFNKKHENINEKIQLFLIEYLINQRINNSQISDQIQISIKEMNLKMNQYMSEIENIIYTYWNIQDFFIEDQVGSSKYSLILGKDSKSDSKKDHFLGMIFCLRSYSYKKEILLDYGISLFPIRICLSGQALEYLMAVTQYASQLDSPLKTNDFYTEYENDYILITQEEEEEKQEIISNVKYQVGNGCIDSTYFVISYSGKGIKLDGDLKALLRIASFNNFKLQFTSLSIKNRTFSDMDLLIKYNIDQVRSKIDSTSHIIKEALGSLSLLSTFNHLGKGITAFLLSPIRSGPLKGSYQGVKALSKGFASSLCQLNNVTTSTVSKIASKIGLGAISTMFGKIHQTTEVLYIVINPQEEVPREFLKQNKKQ